MTDKCNKYEAIFTFGNEEAFNEHISCCEDCKSEQEKMDKISELLKEVRPYYMEKKRNFAKLKMACAVFAIIFSGTVLGIVNFNPDVSDFINYGMTLSADDLGLPVDTYGLLMVE